MTIRNNCTSCQITAAAFAFALMLVALPVATGQSHNALVETKDTAAQPITPLAPLPTNKPITIGPMVVFEEPYHPALEEKTTPATPTSSRQEAIAGGLGTSRPRVAIIIDDMGHHQHLGEQLLALDLNLTYSFLPDTPFAVEQAQTAVRKGREVLVHLPMEPQDPKWHPGLRALYVKDQPDDLRRKTLAMLTDFPWAVGVNTHMGSRLTEDGKAMQVVLQTLKGRSLFFIDSYTNPRSKGMAIAEQLGIPAARRDVFLDNVQDSRQICRRMEELATVAKQRGEAIGIGHPYTTTLQALNECGEPLLQAVDLVHAGQLVR